MSCSVIILNEEHFALETKILSSSGNVLEMLYSNESECGIYAVKLKNDNKTPYNDYKSSLYK